jgi:hypothetical protein
MSVTEGNGQAKKKAVFEDIYQDLPVGEMSAAIDPADTAIRRIRRSIVVAADLSKSICYPGEPLRITFRLYSALKSISEIIKYPGLQGFVVEKKMLENEFPVNKMLYGRVFRVFDLIEYRLYPVDTGVLWIDSMTVSNSIKTSGGANDVIETVSSRQYSVNVIPFPESGKPTRFKGAVGVFSIQTDFPDTVRFMKTDTFRVVIVGQGNLTKIEQPIIDWPSGVDVFEPVIDYAISERAFPDSGSVIFKYPISLKDQFIHRLPAVILYYFEPQTGKYVESVAKEIEFQMIGDAGESIKTKTEKEPLRPPKGPWLVYALGLFILLAIPYLVVRKRRAAKAQVERETVEEIHESVIEEPTPARDYFADVLNLRDIEHPLLYIQKFKQLLNEYILEVSVDAEKELSQDKLDVYRDIINECDMYIYSGAKVPEDIKQRLEAAFKGINS